MTEIRDQIRRAKHRLLLSLFAGRLIWCGLVTGLLATIAVTIPKLWHVAAVDSLGSGTWLAICLGSAITVSILAAGIWTWLTPLSDDRVALEIDRRYGLRERVVSSLMLSDADAQQPFGQALVEDTTRRIAMLEIPEQFPYKPSWTVSLPVLAMLAVVGIMLAIPNAELVAKATSQQQEAEKKLIKETAKELKKKLVKRKQEAKQKGLKDAEALLQEIEQEVSDLTKQPTNRRQSLVKLNNLARDIEKRKEEIGNVNELKKQLQKLGELEKGPAGKAGDALKNGDFNKAKEEVAKIQEKLVAGDFTDVEKQELQKQLEKIQQALGEKAAAHAEAKKNLRDQIEQALAQGDRDLAGDLQQKLSDLQQADPQMDQLQKLGEQLADAAQQLQDGNPGEAAEKLGELAKQLDKLQQQFDEMELLDEAMAELSDCKNGMCKGGGKPGDGLQPGKPGGNGLAGTGGNKQGPPGEGLGKGSGKGERPENPNETGFFESKVAGNVQPGEAVRRGSADGPNIAGKTRESVKKEIAASIASQDDPLTNRRIPKQDREHAEEYFKQFRQGKKTP